MAQPTTKAEFTEWCLRKLGKPVIEINVDEDQVDDRIEEALEMYREYHFDGTEYTYRQHQLTADDITNKYITVPEEIVGVTGIFDIGHSSVSSGSSLFNAQYQWALNNIHSIASTNLTEYVMAKQQIDLLQEILVGSQQVRYNRHMDRVYIDMMWSKVKVGDYIIIRCYSVLDPNTFSDVWKDRWLQNYATAKIKYQWGSNLTKFEGMQLPGGVQFNGQQILTDAKQEIDELEEELKTSYFAPNVDMIG